MLNPGGVVRFGNARQYTLDAPLPQESVASSSTSLNKSVLTGLREKKIVETTPPISSVLENDEAIYTSMMSKGKIWKNCGFDLDHKGLASLCKKNKNTLFLEIKNNLKPEERNFLNKVMKQTLHAVYVTKKDEIKNSVKEGSINFRPREMFGKPDKEDISANNFAFFSIGFSATVRKPSSRHGDTAYSINIEKVEGFKRGCFTLFDPLGPDIMNPQNHIDYLSDESADFLCERLNNFKDENNSDKGKVSDYIYSIIDMKKILALAAIRDIRSLENEEDKRSILQKDGPDEIEKIMIAFFRPQIMVPTPFNVAGKQVKGPYTIIEKLPFTEMSKPWLNERDEETSF